MFFISFADEQQNEQQLGLNYFDSAEPLMENAQK